MAKPRLSQAAKLDLITIAQYGDENFGIKKSNEYRKQLSRHFLLLAKQPYLFQAVDHIRPGYRRSICGVHAIYCRVGNDGVEIMRILGQQDLDKML